MPAYLTLDEFRDLTVMPAEFVNAIETAHADWITKQLEYWSQWIDSRLRKRYAAPFEQPYPNAVRGWLSRLVTVSAWLRRGVDPQDQQFIEVKDDAQRARDEITEAANSDTGLFDLPRRADLTATGIARGGPFGYSEQSPYVAFDAQRRVGRDEDLAGGGSHG